MTSNKYKHYDSKFYNSHRAGMLYSAEKVLSILYEFSPPDSVLDVGCGQGAWLSIAEKLGSNVLVGVDGPWIKGDALLSQKITFIVSDLQNRFPNINQHFDLAMSLEVAEHIKEERADGLVALLCKASDVVLFSGAVPYQGGTNHINERWPSYWIEKFAQHGFICSNFVRDKIWSNEKVEWWYRQNILLFVKKESDRFSLFKDKYDDHIEDNDIVHPDLFMMKMAANEKSILKPSTRFFMSIFKNYLISFFSNKSI